MSPGAGGSQPGATDDRWVDMDQDNASQRPKRVAANLPQHWLHDPAYWDLSHAAWRIQTHALMWSIDRTDGQIPRSMLPMLMPGTDAERNLAVRELINAGHWAETEMGWELPDWEEHQSTKEAIENNRRRARDKKRRQRARTVPGGTTPVTGPGTSQGDSPEGVREGTERHVKEEVLDAPSGDETVCKVCGDTKPAWILEPRGGRCIECARATG